MMWYNTTSLGDLLNGASVAKPYTPTYFMTAPIDSEINKPAVNEIR
jgi:hypothetical protein